MTLDDIKLAIAQLSADERARLRAWLAQTDPATSEPKDEATASKLGRLAGRAVADFRKRLRDT